MNDLFGNIKGKNVIKTPPLSSYWEWIEEGKLMAAYRCNSCGHITNITQRNIRVICKSCYPSIVLNPPTI